MAETTVQGRRDVSRRFARTLSKHARELSLDAVTVQAVHASVFGEANRLPGRLAGAGVGQRPLPAFATGRHQADLPGASQGAVPAPRPAAAGRAGHRDGSFGQLRPGELDGSAR